MSDPICILAVKFDLISIYFEMFRTFLYTKAFWSNLKAYQSIPYHIIRHLLTSPDYIYLPRIAEGHKVNSGLLKQIILATLTTQFLT